MIETWVLILFFHVGMAGSGNSNATTVVTGFIDKQECVQAGTQAKALTSGTVKAVEFTCVKQTQKAWWK